MKFEPLVERVAECVERADRNESRLSERALALAGMSSAKVRHLLNNLCSYADVRYLEVGLHVGSTFCAALCGNSIEAVGVDNWSEFDGKGARAAFESNCAEFVGSNRIRLIYEDAFQVDLERPQPAVNVYLYDGRHDYVSQRRALVHFASALAPTFVYLADDDNLPEVRQGTADAVREFGWECLWERHLPAQGNGDLRNWWNGLYVAVLRRSVSSSQSAIAEVGE